MNTISTITYSKIAKATIKLSLMSSLSMSCFFILILATSYLFLQSHNNPSFISLQSGRGLVFGSPKG
jgi:hypothetical protein